MVLLLCVGAAETWPDPFKARQHKEMDMEGEEHPEGRVVASSEKEELVMEEVCESLLLVAVQGGREV